MTKTDQKWLWVLLIFSVFYNAPQALAQENSQYIKCEKNLMLSSRIGVQKKKQGTELFKYVPNQYLCEVSDLEKGKCYVRYQGASWLERDDAIIGFDKSPKYPRDSTVIVLDLKSLEFYKTVKQVEMRYTIWGKCQFIAKPIIKGAKQVWMIMEFFNGF